MQQFNGPLTAASLRHLLLSRRNERLRLCHSLSPVRFRLCVCVPDRRVTHAAVFDGCCCAGVSRTRRSTAGKTSAFEGGSPSFISLVSIRLSCRCDCVQALLSMGMQSRLSLKLPHRPVVRRDKVPVCSCFGCLSVLDSCIAGVAGGSSSDASASDADSDGVGDSEADDAGDEPADGTDGEAVVPLRGSDVADYFTSAQFPSADEEAEAAFAELEADFESEAGPGEDMDSDADLDTVASPGPAAASDAVDYTGGSLAVIGRHRCRAQYRLKLKRVAGGDGSVGRYYVQFDVPPTSAHFHELAPVNKTTFDVQTAKYSHPLVENHFHKMVMVLCSAVLLLFLMSCCDSAVVHAGEHPGDCAQSC